MPINNRFTYPTGEFSPTKEIASNAVSACPSCEYEKNSPGRPIQEGDHLKCLDCGSTWRQYGNRPISYSTLAEPEQPAPSREKPTPRFIEDKFFKARSEDDGFQANSSSSFSQTSNGVTGFQITLVACFLFFAVLFGTVLGLNFLTPVQNKETLHIADVQMQELMRGGTKVFTVRGNVNNNTNTRRAIPRIAIILKKSGGEEVFRWYYKSSKTVLEAGGKSKFATSVQYNAPIVAYAEAVFD
ncbi:MAG: hypothetical protein AAGF54_00365 [Pseudomonadota bacterium]